MTYTGSILISRYCYLFECSYYLYVHNGRGKFLPHKFLNLIRILLLPKCSALSHMYCVHFIATKTNNFLLSFELNQVCNNIYNNSRCFTFSRMNFQRLFFYFMICMKKTNKPLLKFTCFLSDAFNDPGVILGSFNCLW